VTADQTSVKVADVIGGGYLPRSSGEVLKFMIPLFHKRPAVFIGGRGEQAQRGCNVGLAHEHEFESSLMFLDGNPTCGREGHIRQSGGGLYVTWLSQPHRLPTASNRATMTAYGQRRFPRSTEAGSGFAVGRVGWA
jgi:hypothetical protein